MKLSFLVVTLLMGTAQAEPADVARLRKAPRFSSLVGDEPCLSEDASSFIRLLGEKRPEPFMLLARAKTAAAQLYSLCGLEALQSPEAAVLRERLSTSTLRTEVQYGCVAKNAEVKFFFRGFSDGTPTEFDQVCKSLTDVKDSSRKVVLCKERRARQSR